MVDRNVDDGCSTHPCMLDWSCFPYRCSFSRELMRHVLCIPDNIHRTPYTLTLTVVSICSFDCRSWRVLVRMLMLVLVGMQSRTFVVDLDFVHVHVLLKVLGQSECSYAYLILLHEHPSPRSLVSAEVVHELVEWVSVGMSVTDVVSSASARMPDQTG